MCSSCVGIWKAINSRLEALQQAVKKAGNLRCGPANQPEFDHLLQFTVRLSGELKALRRKLREHRNMHMRQAFADFAATKARVAALLHEAHLLQQPQGRGGGVDEKWASRRPLDAVASFMTY